MRMMGILRSLLHRVTVTENAAALIDRLIRFLLPPTHYLSHLPWTDLREIDRICSTNTNILRPLIKALHQMDACDTAAPTHHNWSRSSYQSDGGREHVERWYFPLTKNIVNLGRSRHPHIEVYGRR